MEVKEIVKRVISWTLLIAAYVGVFFISIPAGIFSILFTGIGYIAGYTCKHLKNQEQFFNILTAHKEDILEGKIVNLIVDEDAEMIKVFISDAVTGTKKSSKKKNTKTSILK